MNSYQARELGAARKKRRQRAEARRGGGEGAAAGGGREGGGWGRERQRRTGRGCRRKGERSMKIADVSINRPVFAIMMSLALVVLGIFSYRTLGVDLMPKTDQPTV